MDGQTLMMSLLSLILLRHVVVVVVVEGMMDPCCHIQTTGPTIAMVVFVVVAATVGMVIHHTR